MYSISFHGVRDNGNINISLRDLVGFYNNNYYLNKTPFAFQPFGRVSQACCDFFARVFGWFEGELKYRVYSCEIHSETDVIYIGLCV